MQPASDKTVLGNFNDSTFTHLKLTSTFFRRGEKFMVRTDGADGKPHDFEIAYSFGIYPLQQYLIPMSNGRLQALGIAWDARPRERGGQRWFFLYDDQKIAPSDPLHWTGIDQTWNFMCADCHSTNLRKNYDLSKRSYATTYAEIEVGCEACHGPGSDHLKWANKSEGGSRFAANEGLTISLDERRGVGWTIDAASGNAKRSRPRETLREIEMCARCHSRRGAIHEDYVHGQPVSDDYRVALLDRELYFPDGQIKGEVYEYGSFLQSRMFHAGVTCSDCHDPHSGKLRAAGNSVCLQCHASTKYAAPTHHFHKPETAGASCVGCHMPTRTYMMVDDRRDHSIRIPRPDLTQSIGTPNACNQCHADKSASWAAETVVKWYGHVPQGYQHFAETLEAGRQGAPGAQEMLPTLVADRDQPDIARATALSLAASSGYPLAHVIGNAGECDAILLRRAAASAISEAESGASEATAGALLNDRVRAVRIEAAEALVGKNLPSNLHGAYDHARTEYIDAQQLNADRPEAHLNLALLFVREDNPDKAEAELKTALSLDPSFAPAAVNLADLDREMNKDTQGEAVLRQALKVSPDNADLLQALGLVLVRQGHRDQALAALAASVKADSSNPGHAYVYAVALNESGRTETAISILEQSIKTHPYDRDSLAALVSFCERQGDRECANRYATRLKNLVR